MRRCLIVFIMCCLFSSYVLAAGPVFLTSVNAAATPSLTRITFTLSEKTRGHVRSYTLPGRVEIEFENTYTNTPFKKQSFLHANIKSMSKAWSRKGVIRFVFLLQDNVEWKTTFQPDKGTARVRMQLDLITKNHAHAKLTDLFQKGVTSTYHVVSKEASNRKPPVSTDVKKIIAQTKETTTAPAKKIVPATAASTSIKAVISKAVAKNEPSPTPVLMNTLPKKSMIVIAIDAGHGGKDPGALGSKGTKEKDVVLKIAKLIAAEINKHSHRRAILTRQADYYVPLRRRLRLARQHKADVFIAIHADAHYNHSAKGSSVYVLSPHGASSEAARWLANRENFSELGAVSLNNLVDTDPMLRSVMVDLAQTATIHASLRLGQSVLNALDDVGKLHHDDVERAPFVVLKSPDIPSILVETGFITNASEEARLKNPRYQKQLAQAIYSGLEAYLKQLSS